MGRADRFANRTLAANTAISNNETAAARAAKPGRPLNHCLKFDGLESPASGLLGTAAAVERVSLPFISFEERLPAWFGNELGWLAFDLILNFFLTVSCSRSSLS